MPDEPAEPSKRRERCLKSIDFRALRARNARDAAILCVCLSSVRQDLSGLRLPNVHT